MSPKTASTSPKHKRKQQTTVSGGIQRHAKKGRKVQRQDLTMKQQTLASRLANDFSGPQRKDSDLLDRMRKKYSNSSSPALLDAITPTPKKKVSIPAQSDKEEIGWEERASEGIKTKELSLNRQWNEVTWKNKSSCHERLKLLKDDGVDITPLQGHKLSSDAITRAVIAQVDARKRQTGLNTSAQPTVNNDGVSALPSGLVNNIPQTTFDPVFDNLEYRPLSTEPLKRKRGSTPSTDVVDPSEPHSLTNEDEPAFKKRCIMDLRLEADATMTEEETPTWENLRSKVRRDLFASVSEVEAKSTTTSRIIINFPSQSSAAVDTLGTLVLNSKGYDNIMQDLRAFADPEDKDGNFTILGSVTDGSGIRIITSEPRCTIIEGKTSILIALIRRFCTPGKGLLHIAKRYFDKHGFRKAWGAAFELGGGTQKELGMIMEELWKVKIEDTAFDVDVKWVYVGRTEKWPEKMY